MNQTMVAIDTSVLIYAHQEELPKHHRAKKRLKELAEGAESWLLPVFCIGEFLRILSHPKLFSPAYSANETTEALGRILLSPSLEILYPGERHVAILKNAIEEAAVVGNLVFHAQIVAVCRKRGGQRLLTEDRDFTRFSGIKCEYL